MTFVFNPSSFHSLGPDISRQASQFVECDVWISSIRSLPWKGLTTIFNEKIISGRWNFIQPLSYNHWWVSIEYRTIEVSQTIIDGFRDSWWIPSIIISAFKLIAFLRLRQLCSSHVQRPPVLPPLRDHWDSFHALCPRRCWRHHGWTASGDLDLHVM